MRIKEKYYPHPVLNYYNDDIVNGTFTMKVDPSIQNGNIIFKFSSNLWNDDLQDLLDRKEARYDVHMECAKTRFRKVISFFNNSYTHEIPISKLEGNLEVCFFISATTDIYEYQNKNFNLEYGSEAKFYIRKYDTLAIAEGLIIPIKKRSRKQSIFNVILNREKDAEPFHYEINSDKLQIFLNQKNYINYNNLSKSGNEQSKLLIVQTVFPVLVGVLEVLSMEDLKDESEYKNYQWYRTLRHKLNEVGVDISNQSELEGRAASLALKILSGSKDPYTEALETLIYD